LTDNASLNTTFAYDPTNTLTSRTLPNGVVSTYQYDGLNRLTRLTHAGFNEFVRKKTKDLQRQKGCTEVEYVVETVDHQVKLKALVKS